MAVPDQWATTYRRSRIIMFCGLPVTVATLPMFDAIATARR
jgi:hypothetical protein